MNTYQHTKVSPVLIKYFYIFIFFIFSSLSILQAKTKIMPLGDSITWDQHYGDSRIDAYRSGYRSHLWYKLRAENYNIDFVGSRHNGSAVRPSYDGHNESAWGRKSYQVATSIYGYLTKNTPDIILLHIGTNDVTNGSAANGVAGVERILNEIDRKRQECQNQGNLSKNHQSPKRSFLGFSIQ